MPIKFACPSCRAKLRLAEHLAGSTTQCPECGAAISIPALGKVVGTQRSGSVPRPAVVQSSSSSSFGTASSPTSDMAPPNTHRSGSVTCTGLSVLLGIGALPFGVAIASNLAAMFLATVGSVFGLLGCTLALVYRRSAFGSAFAGLLMCGSALLVTVLLNRTRPESSEGAYSSGGLEKPGTESKKVSKLLDIANYPNMGAVLTTYTDHVVVFPTQGTLREKVQATLEELFPPGTITEIRRDVGQRETMLKDQLAKSLEGIPELAKTAVFLEQLAKRDIHFKGYLSGDAAVALAGVIQRGGVFTIKLAAGPPRLERQSQQVNVAEQRHGSLLHVDGVKQILAHAGREDGQGERLLTELKQAIQAYASLNDALNIIGNRTAFLVTVDPTAAAHEEALKKLTERVSQPVFVPRPPPRLFDAIDPAEDVGSGSAVFTLRLPRKCWWRQASQEDRKRVDQSRNTTKDRMKWQVFEADKIITWNPVPLALRDGRSIPVSSYDIAIGLPDRVVIFRNQNLFLGGSREEVLAQATTYITARLKLDVQPIEDAINTSQQDKHYVGTLLYSTLADNIAAGQGNKDNDLEVYTAKEFAKLVETEDAEIEPTAQR